MQALKLIRRAISISSPAVSRLLVSSLCSVADASRDDFRRVCIDSLRELSLLCPSVVASVDGFRAMFEAALDGNDQTGPLILTLLYLWDVPHTRPLLGSLQVAPSTLAVFTDSVSMDSAERELKRAAAHRVRASPPLVSSHMSSLTLSDRRHTLPLIHWNSWTRAT